MLKLSPRLSAIAGLVRRGSRVADVGTDHGYIPVWLVQNNIAASVIATDIKGEPLSRAMKTAEELGMSGAIGFRLCDGLDGCDCDSIDTVIIAGMGGENIAGILKRAPWTREGNRVLILQPMTRPEHLRMFLYENGYTIERELLVRDSGKLYTVLLAKGGKDDGYMTPAEMLAGRPGITEGPYLEHLDALIDKTTRALEGVSVTRSQKDLSVQRYFVSALDGLYQIREKFTMIHVEDICGYLEKLIPLEIKMEFDNPGLLVGMTHKEVSTVLVALDVTDEVIDEARDTGAQLVVVHHPIFFGLKNIVDTDPIGRKIINLISSGISALCLHTPLDSVSGGLNDELIAVIGAENTGILEICGTAPDGRPYGPGRMGTMGKEMPFEEFLSHIKENLNANGLRYHNAGRGVRNIAVCGGAGGDFAKLAIEKGCDTYISSDLKYNHFIDAKEAGMNLIDADHFCTENVCVGLLARLIKEGFPTLDVRVSGHHAQTTQFYS